MEGTIKINIFTGNIFVTCRTSSETGSVKKHTGIQNKSKKYWKRAPAAARRRQINIRV